MCHLRGRLGVYNCRINLFLRLPQESKQASSEASKEASKRASKQAEKQASKQASKKAIKQSSKSSKVIKMSQNVTKCHKNVTKISQKCHKNELRFTPTEFLQKSSKWLTFWLPFETSFSTELGGRIIFPGRCAPGLRGPSRKSTTICLALVHADVNKLTPSKW